VAEPTAPVPANPLHPLALPLLHPQQVLMLGALTLHRPVSALLADPSVPVLALTTGPRWPDVSGNSLATGTRAVTRGAPDEAWLHRCAEVNRHALAAVRDQLTAHPLTTGCTWPPPSPPRFGPATNWSSGRPTRCATWPWPDSPLRASRCGPTAASPGSTEPCRRPSAPRCRTTAPAAARWR
jgi:2-succinyl-5-enolpyruvyl-6-hydroxy-3-cyclohexene-1-carboxylate synthase